MEHAGPFWTERVKTVLDATNWAHLISELAPLKADFGTSSQFGPSDRQIKMPIWPQQGLCRSELLLPSKGAQGDRSVWLK